jgi:ribosomal protein L14
MIKKRTVLHVTDNCGVIKARVIHHIFGFKKKTSYLGHFNKVSVRKRKTEYAWIKSKRVNIPRKGKKLKAYFVRSRYNYVKPDGSRLNFKTNSAVILKKRLTIRGKYVFGPFVYGLRRKKILGSFPGLL